MRNRPKRIPFTILFAKDVVMRLMLPIRGRQVGPDMFAEELDGDALVGTDFL